MTKKIIEVGKPRQLTKKQGNNGQLRLGQISKVIQLDKRFRIVSLFPDLKLFQHYNKIV